MNLNYYVKSMQLNELFFKNVTYVVPLFEIYYQTSSVYQNVINHTSYEILQQVL
jgi:hypothetical protein